MFYVFAPWNSNVVVFLLKNTILGLRGQYDQYCTLVDQSDCRYFVR